MASKYFDKVIARRKPETKIFVSKYLDIVERIHQILQAKGMTQKDLAKAMEKRESEISRWLSGEHNLTLKSIAKLEAALGEEIISIPASTFLEWRETRVSHMKVMINKDAENLDKGLSFQKPVISEPNNKNLAS